MFVKNFKNKYYFFLYYVILKNDLHEIILFHENEEIIKKMH